jgi:hypothetical protein
VAAGRIPGEVDGGAATRAVDGDEVARSSANLIGDIGLRSSSREENRRRWSGVRAHAGSGDTETSSSAAVVHELQRQPHRGHFGFAASAWRLRDDSSPIRRKSRNVEAGAVAGSRGRRTEQMAREAHVYGDGRSQVTRQALLGHRSAAIRTSHNSEAGYSSSSSQGSHRAGRPGALCRHQPGGAISAHRSPLRGVLERFWKLLYESRLVPEAIGHVDDDRLPGWGYGINNIVPRPTPGIDTLRPDEYVRGPPDAAAEDSAFKPAVVVTVGITVFRALFPERKGAVALAVNRKRIGDASVSFCPTERQKCETTRTPRCSPPSAPFGVRSARAGYLRWCRARHNPASDNARAEHAMSPRLPTTRCGRERAASRLGEVITATMNEPVHHASSEAT